MPQHFKGKKGAARKKALREHRKATKKSKDKKGREALMQGFSTR